MGNLTERRSKNPPMRVSALLGLRFLAQAVGIFFGTMLGALFFIRVFDAMVVLWFFGGVAATIWNFVWYIKATIALIPKKPRKQTVQQDGARALWDMPADKFYIFARETLARTGISMKPAAYDFRGFLRFQANDPSAQVRLQSIQVLCIHQPEVGPDVVLASREGLVSIQRSMVITSGFFSDEAKSAAEGMPVTLVDGDALAAMASRLAKPQLFGV
jgi:hypothetical protein